MNAAEKRRSKGFSAVFLGRKMGKAFASWTFVPLAVDGFSLCYPVKEGRLPADPSKKMVPTTML